ncbi:MAG: cytochrome o ubiquinol oxidase subunit IV [Gammaproteobacteria bacterium]|nr:MAG: cytochrome o ubiquinol oxidase subunit IV [Gammaproteobacteria bacterium]
MEHQEVDYGTGQKTLGIYIVGLIICVILTLVAFWTVMSGRFAKWEMFTIIYLAAIIQFITQLICFLRLNTQTEQGRHNVMSLIFTGVILISIVAGSLWIMWNLDYNMQN